jgi:drug/metabolite transporter (DMT)-like permease
VPLFAVIAVLLASATHATWNLAAKRAAGSRHFVWMYSIGSVALYLPIVLWILVTDRPHWGRDQWLALCGTSVFHLGYSLVLQAGYRASDLSLVYPLARGSGPLLSFAGAVLFLGERLTWLAGLGLACVVVGIALVAGLIRQPHRAPRAGVFFGLLTGVFIACYTLNDGWAVKELGITPVFIDFTGNLVRIVVLTPFALRASSTIREEVHRYGAAAAVVSVLGPLGYILVLYAMRMAPISHVAPARELATLLGAYFGSRLLREGAAPERLVGAALIVVGVISLAFAR